MEANKVVCVFDLTSVLYEMKIVFIRCNVLTERIDAVVTGWLRYTSYGTSSSSL